MKRRIKNILCIVISVIIFLPSICLANSMPTYYYGSGEAVNDALLLNKECPIEVRNEVLTFDLQEFPKDYYEHGKEFNEYAGEVKAEYTFFNPTKEKLTARLAFPFGNKPEYAPYDLGEDVSGEWWKKIITVDGKEIEPVIRLTYYGYGNFNAYEEREKLIDGYVEDSFYKPDLPVTKYTYDIEIDDKNASNIWADMEVTIDTEKSKIITDGYISMSNKNTAIIEVDVVDSQVEFYVLGEADFELNWKFEDWENEKTVVGKANVNKIEEKTFEEFVLQNLGENTDGRKSDKYNACISYLKECEQTKGIVTECYIQYLSEQLIYWYEYEIIFEPGDTVKNEVTAPIYPSIETAYEPPVYEYMYLLSPAKLWNEFGDLEIIIQTPFHMTECSVKGFEKTDEGYRLRRSGLPKGELEFVLSKSENPKMDPDILSYRVTFFFYTVGIPVLLVGAIAFILFIVHRKRKKENS